MEPVDPTSWLDLAADKSGPLGVFGVLALGMWQAWLKFGEHKAAPAPAPVPDPAPVVDAGPPVDSEARDRLTLLEHQHSTTAAAIAEIRDMQQRDHDAIVSMGPKLDAIRDVVVDLRDAARR